MKKKPDVLMELLLQIAENMKECGEVFSRFEMDSSSDLKSFSEQIKSFETKGDSLVHETIVELNHAFITAIEQEDILELAEKMDEVVDNMEECASYFYMYALKEDDDYIIEFRQQLGLCACELYNAIEMLVEHKLVEIREHTVNVKSYEEICDSVERKAIRKLFKKCTDPIRLIQFKDLYEMLENAVDSSQEVAKALDTIVMKNM